MSIRNAVLVLGAWVLSAGCAIGANEVRQTDAPSLMGNPNMLPTGGGGSGGTGEPSTMVPNEPDASMAMFVGDVCERGAMEPCACEASSAMGERICTANPASPTGGAFSECRGCPAAPDAGSVSGGVGGASGASGASGMSGGVGGAMPTGGMSGGAGGMGGAGGAPACACTDLLACCRDDGTCGVGVPGACF